MKTKGIPRWLSKWSFVACGIWLIGLGGYFMFARPPLLPEDLRYLGQGASQLDVISPRLGPWLQQVFTVTGGFMAGCGVLVVFVGIRAVPRCLRGTGISLGFVGVLTVATMSWTNFVLDSDFKWLVAAPAIAWLFGLVCYGGGMKAEHTFTSIPQADEEALK